MISSSVPLLIDDNNIEEVDEHLTDWRGGINFFFLSVGIKSQTQKNVYWFIYKCVYPRTCEL